ncbi:MAG: ATP synthase F1 subunit epsilon [Anaerorhabdus sp.]
MIHCKIVTPLGLYKELDTSILNIQNGDGKLGILPSHMPLVTMLEISKMTTVEDGNREEYAIGGGLLYFENDGANILVDSIENKNDIDEERAMAAKLRAETRLDEHKKSTDMAKAEVALKRAINRLSVKGG